MRENLDERTPPLSRRLWGEGSRGRGKRRRIPGKYWATAQRHLARAYFLQQALAVKMAELQALIAICAEEPPSVRRRLLGRAY